MKRIMSYIRYRKAQKQRKEFFAKVMMANRSILTVKSDVCTRRK
jgi:hypothetical protein